MKININLNKPESVQVSGQQNNVFSEMCTDDMEIFAEVAVQNTETYSLLETITTDDVCILECVSQQAEIVTDDNLPSVVSPQEKASSIMQQEIIHNLEEFEQEKFEEQLSKIALQYLGKPVANCTPQELGQAYALYEIENNMLTSQVSFEKQQKNDGIISDFGNLLKEITTIGVDEKEAIEAIEKQNYILAQLKIAIKEGNFEKRYLELTGVEFNYDKITEYQQKTTELQFISAGIQRIDDFNNALIEPDVLQNPNKTLEKFIEFYGKEKGTEEFKNILLSGFNELISECGEKDFVADIEFSDEKGLTLYLKDGTTQYVDYASMNPAAMSGIYGGALKEKLTNEFIEKLKAIGLDYEQIAKDQKRLSDEAFGDANAVVNLVYEHVASQENFIDKIGTGAQLTGMGFMLVGSVLSFVKIKPEFQLVSKALISAGQLLSVAGTFGDNALERIDLKTNDNFYIEDKEAYEKLLKETITDTALFASGYLIGAVSGSFADDALATLNNKNLLKEAWSKTKEISVDASLSLLADYMITGEVDLKGEGFSQFLGVLTGTAMAKNLYAKGVDYEARPYERVNPPDNDAPDSRLFNDDIAGDSLKLELGESNSSKILQVDATELTDVEIKNLADEFVKMIAERDVNNVINNFEQSKKILREIFGQSMDEGFIDEIAKACGSTGHTLIETWTPQQFEAMLKFTPEEKAEFAKLVTEQSGYTSLGNPELRQKFSSVLYGDYVDNALVAQAQTINDQLAANGIETRIILGSGIASDPTKGLYADARANSDFEQQTKLGNQACTLPEGACTIMNHRQLELVGDAIMRAKQQGLAVPEKIYIEPSIYNVQEHGGVFDSNTGTMALKVQTHMAQNEGKILFTTFHEIMHVNDPVDANGIHFSEIRAREYTTFENGVFSFDGTNASSSGVPQVKITAKEFNDCISAYSASKPSEFVAEVGALIQMGAIVKSEDGSYTIDKSKAPEGYCNDWSGTQENIASLKNIMALYKYLTD